VLGLGSSSEENDTHILTAVEEDIHYCLNILKINKHDDETEIRIKKAYAQNIALSKIYHKRLITLKIIADFVTLTSNTLSQSQLYDFLMLSTAALSSEEMKEYKSLRGTTTSTNDMVFKIYGDLIENYQTADDILRLNYPQIIVDVVAALSRGIDTRGKQVSVYRVYDYYLSRKSDPMSNSTEIGILSSIESDQGKNKTEQGMSNSDLIQSLTRITGRNGEEIRESLSRLNNSDIVRIRNLCTNYPKIDKYCRLVALDRKYFIDEIEREQGGIKLTKHQLHIAVVSIKKVRKYIENVLDRKFVPHSSHHINHTKHNLEYGYQVMGLIGSIRRIGKKENGSSRR
jgi:hypothetical protein